MRQTVHPAYGERCWVIELADQTWAKIPLAWAVAVDDTTESESSIVEAASGLWGDVAGLLDLVIMVRHLTTDPLEEATNDEQFSVLTPGERMPPAEQHDERAPPLGTVTSSTATRDGSDSGDDIEPPPQIAAATTHPSGATGGTV